MHLRMKLLMHKMRNMISVCDLNENDFLHSISFNSLFFHIYNEKGWHGMAHIHMYVCPNYISVLSICIVIVSFYMFIIFNGAWSKELYHLAKTYPPGLDNVYVRRQAFSSHTFDTLKIS